MKKALFGLLACASLLLFFAGGTVLDYVGWPYTFDSAPTTTKIHPATYLLLIATVVATFYAPYRVINRFTSRIFLFYLLATAILFGRAIGIVMSGNTGGELSAVITNFITPALILIVAHCMATEDLRKIGIGVRAFFVLNSLMALAERAIGHRFIPGFLDNWHELRSAAFVMHPLNGSLLTGAMIIFLVTARRADTPIWYRVGELLLHTAAMFAFGGRSAIVFTVTILLLSSVLGQRKQGQADLSFMQRVLPFAIVLLGTCLIFLPLEFVDATIDRFTNDNNSSQTRNSAMQMFLSLPSRDLWFGLDISQRMAISRFYNTEQGIELSWIAMAMSYGILATLPMLFALPLMMISMARTLDRSAFYMAVFFLVVSAGSLSIGVKSLLVAQLFVMMLTLAQPNLLANRAGSRSGRRSSLDGLFGDDQEGRPRRTEAGAGALSGAGQAATVGRSGDRPNASAR